MDPTEDTNVSVANNDGGYDENYDGNDTAPSQDFDSSSASGSDGHYEQDDDQEQEEEEEEEEEQLQAPAYKIPSRTIAAVEHPFLIMDVDKGLDTFGPNPQYQSVSPEPVTVDAYRTTMLIYSRSWTPETPSSRSPSISIPRIPRQGP